MIRIKVAPLVAGGSISVAWAAPALDPANCATKTAGSSDNYIDEPVLLQLDAAQPGY